MESARKVALVPQQLLSALMAQQQLNPALGQLTAMDKSMQSMLQTTDIPSDVKHKQYNNSGEGDTIGRIFTGHSQTVDHILWSL